MEVFKRMPPPTIYKESLEGEEQTPQAISSKEMYIRYQQHKNAVVTTPKLFFVPTYFCLQTAVGLLYFLSVCFITSLLNILHHTGDFPKL